MTSVYALPGRLTADVVGPLALSPAEVAELDRVWAVEKAAQPHIFDGPLLTITAVDVVDEDTAHVTFAESRFAHYLCTRRHDEGRVRPVHSTAGDAVVRTADNQWCLPVLGSASSYTGRVKFFGGVVEDTDVDEQGALSFSHAAQRELEEELGLHIPLSCLDPALLITPPEVTLFIPLLVASVERTADELRDVFAHHRATLADGADEVRDVLFVPATPDGVDNLLRDHGEILLPYVAPTLRCLVGGDQPALFSAYVKRLSADPQVEIRLEPPS